MKEIYYILDDNNIVVDFTEETTSFLYGTIPKEMTIEELKTILEFDCHTYTFKDNVLTSVVKEKVDETILQLQQENELLRKRIEENKKEQQKLMENAERNADMTKNSVFELTEFVGKLAQHVGLDLEGSEDVEDYSDDSKDIDVDGDIN